MAHRCFKQNKGSFKYDLNTHQVAKKWDGGRDTFQIDLCSSLLAWEKGSKLLLEWENEMSFLHKQDIDERQINKIIISV